MSSPSIKSNKTFETKVRNQIKAKGRSYSQINDGDQLIPAIVAKYSRFMYELMSYPGDRLFRPPLLRRRQWACQQCARRLSSVIKWLAVIAISQNESLSRCQPHYSRFLRYHSRCSALLPIILTMLITLPNAFYERNTVKYCRETLLW